MITFKFSLPYQPIANVVNSRETVVGQCFGPMLDLTPSKYSQVPNKRGALIDRGLENSEI